MNLSKKKALAARALNVGKARILFNVQRLGEIKEAITKQDIRDLHKEGIILIKEVKGRRKLVRRNTRKRMGSRKKRILNKKHQYVTLTRKFRRYLAYLKNKKAISKEHFLQLRREIRARMFQTLTQLKERIKEVKAK